ncbi:MAG: LysR family transcriptional regulator [Clostridia bacterium]
MNVSHFKYALEIARTKSISKAAENLFMGQPNLSRAIKELEEQIGVTIFKRTPKGIIVTTQGEEFLMYAKNILSQVKKIENIYARDNQDLKQFSVCVPRSNYITDAFTEFSNDVSKDHPVEFHYKETDTMGAIGEVVAGNYNLGILRYKVINDAYYKAILDEKRLEYQTITELECLLTFSRNSELYNMERITAADLKDFVQICTQDNISQIDSPFEPKKIAITNSVERRIFISDRCSQFEALSKIHNSFTFLPYTSDSILNFYNLYQSKIKLDSVMYKDVLIYSKDYKMNKLEDDFTTYLCQSRRKILGF